MVQLRPGGKNVFSWCKIQPNGQLQLPPDVCDEYALGATDKVIAFSGSKQTGGFCVSTEALLATSALAHILEDMPELARYATPAGSITMYKGRQYAWLAITAEGVLTLNEEFMTGFDLQTGDKLLAIRSSNIAFTLGAKGPLIETAEIYEGDIAVF